MRAIADHAVEALGRALREHHRGTAEHSHRCARLAGVLAQRLGLPADEAFEVALVALLHDVGKLMVDPALLDQRTVLSPGRRERLCRHAADGGAIPLAARIVAAADTFDAMSASRAYRRALPRAEAMRRLLEAAGIQLDPRVVDALVETLPGRVPTLSR